MIKFNGRYFGWAALLFATEVIIALYVHDGFVRPYIGDLLVVILLYCFVKSFLAISAWKAAICVLIFSFIIEGLQYLHIVTLLGLQHNTFARIVIGTSFQWFDLVAYTTGIAIVVGIEKVKAIRSKTRDIISR